MKIWGWEFSNNSSTQFVDFVELNQIPIICGKLLQKEELFELVTELEENPSSINIPIVIQKILNYKACRSAIKFGDYLSKENAEMLIEQLSQTEFPFQCAHG